MRDRKLYDLLRRLSAEERALFAEYLRSPLHAHRPKLADMVLLMESMLFATPDRDCSSEEFYAAFYPGKPFDGNNLNRLISVITTEFKEFLALRFFQRDRTARAACATREMSRRRWDDILPKEIALTRKVLQEELPDDEHNYYQLYCLEYESARHYMENAGKKGDLVYQPMIDAAENYFALLRTKLISITYVYDVNFKTIHKIRWTNEGKGFDATEPAQTKTTYRLFKFAESLLTINPSKDLYTKFSSLLEDELPYFDRQNFPLNGGLVNKVDSELLYMLGDVAAFQILAGDRASMITAQLRNGKIGIDKGILLEEGFLNTKSYQNYIRTSVVIGRIQEAWEFLRKNAPLLTEKEQQVAPELSAALLYIIEENLDTALSTLLKLKSKLTINSNTLNHLETRLMLCIVWFKRKDYDSLHHEANAMRTFVNRVKITIKAKAVPYTRFLTAIMAIEKTESMPQEKMTERYRKLLRDFEFGPGFTGKGLLRTEILKRYGPEIENWHQNNSGAN